MVDADEVVRAFNACINARDLEAIAQLMAPDYTFVDSAGTIEHGRAAGIAAWRAFFTQFPDYRNVFATVDVRDDLVIVTGRSVCSVEALDGPAIWTARVRGEQVTEWRVHDDTPPQRLDLDM